MQEKLDNFFASSLFKSVTIYVRYQGWDEILMITLISSKKLGVCNNMRNTVPNLLFRCHIKMTCLQKQFISFLWCVKILPKFLEIGKLLPRFRCFVCWSPGAHWHTSMISDISLVKRKAALFVQTSRLYLP